MPRYPEKARLHCWQIPSSSLAASGGEILSIENAFTPVSRFWALDSYEIGSSPHSYDKQFIRDYLNGTGWDKQPPAPNLPQDVIDKTREKYLNIYKIITGKELS
jgi:phosphoribosylaminoimidazole-succinocarboxamide synthase